MLTIAVDHAGERRQAVVEEHILLVGAGRERVGGQRWRRGLRRRRQLVLPEHLQAAASPLLDAREGRQQLAQARDHPRDCIEPSAKMACCYSHDSCHRARVVCTASWLHSHDRHRLQQRAEMLRRALLSSWGPATHTGHGHCTAHEQAVRSAHCHACCLAVQGHTQPTGHNVLQGLIFRAGGRVPDT